MERTYLMVKPDGVQRGLAGEIIARFEKKGFKIAALKMLRISRELAEKHYGEHVGKPFFEGLVGFITSGPVVAMVIEGKDAVSAAREMMGATNPLKAAAGHYQGRLWHRYRPECHPWFRFQRKRREGNRPVLQGRRAVGLQPGNRPLDL